MTIQTKVQLPLNDRLRDLHILGKDLREHEWSAWIFAMALLRSAMSGEIALEEFHNTHFYKDIVQGILLEDENGHVDEQVLYEFLTEIMENTQADENIHLSGLRDEWVTWVNNREGYE